MHLAASWGCAEDAPALRATCLRPIRGRSGKAFHMHWQQDAATLA
jgi:hypothetical protein